MILFFAPGGRLGNQLFQAAFIEAHRSPGERVVVAQFGRVRVLFGRLERYIISNSPFVINLIDHLLNPLIFHGMVKTRIFGSVIEKDDGLNRCSGLLPVTYLRGYFQDDRYLDPQWLPRAIQRHHFTAAERVFSEAEGRTPLFVHVRRGDYAQYWIHNGGSPLLPYLYYAEGIRKLISKVDNPHFFFVGDDPDWTDRRFVWLQQKTVSRLNMYEDLALMTLCAGGVISNSSFAIWGAALCRRCAPIVAPRYWLGWRLRKWYPRNIEHRGFEYIEVPLNADEREPELPDLKTGRRH